MCLIVCKPKGLPMPKFKRMKSWFDLFSDGVGIAFQHHNKVRVVKGAMSKREMKQLMSMVRSTLMAEGKSETEVDLIIQFRQAFTGAVTRAFCHPFPVSPEQSDLDSLDTMADYALAHNGVIREYSDQKSYGQGKIVLGDKNDAQEFIKDYLVPMGDSLLNLGVQRLIGAHTASKFALLTKDRIVYIGQFIEDGGYLYSNLAYKPTTYDDYSTTLLPLDTRPTDDKVGLVCDFCRNHYRCLYHIEDDMLLCYGCYKALI